MAEIQFETTINCQGCVLRVKDTLNKLVGENNWRVDTDTPRKILTVVAHPTLQATQVVEALGGIGFEAKPV